MRKSEQKMEEIRVIVKNLEQAFQNSDKESLIDNCITLESLLDSLAIEFKYEQENKAS